MQSRRISVLNVIILSCFISLNVIHAQEKSKTYLDALYNRLISQESDIKTFKPTLIYEPEKCGFPLMAEIHANLNYFTSDQQAEIKKVMNRPELETSIVSPSGFFRIHFNMTGTIAPSYEASLTAGENALLVAEAFDSAYSYEVGNLGFLPPPLDSGSGGDDLYDVYIDNTGSFYGETKPETGLDHNRATSYIKIHYDFADFKTVGLSAMQVTAAHELHHAIQLAYVLRWSDLFFMEITSTAMEEFVYDDVNDYYHYISHYFNNTSKVFSINPSLTPDGYDLGIWNIFLADTLGIDIIKRQWELMPQMNAVEAIQQSLNEKGTSFFEMMNQFGIWCYFTGYRAQKGKYFEEAANYPVIIPMDHLSFNTSSKSFSLNSPPLANTYVTFVSADANPDSLTVVLSNSNYKAALATPGNKYPINYTLFNYAADGASRLNNDYYYDYSPHNEYWSTAEMLSNQIIKDGYFIDAIIDYAFPSPFFYSRNSFIYIPAEAVAFENTYLNVYSTGMNLVYSSPVEINKLYGKDLVRWNPKDNEGNNLPSGVYIYALRTGDNNSTGKIVIFK